MMASDRALSESRSVPLIFGLLPLETVCQLIVLLMGARCAYAGRNLPVGADGLAYLDVAQSYVRHDWHTALNGYWGPMYAWLLAIAMWIFHPDRRYEFAVARALNFAIFAAALFAFRGYWRTVAEWRNAVGENQISIPSDSPRVWIALGYLLFA